MPYHIRPIRPEDNAQVARIIRQVMTEFDCVGPGYSIEDPEVDDMHGAYQQRASFYVIEGDGEVLGCGGFAQLQGSDPAICELKKMYFLPQLRGSGMGRQLLEHCLAQAKTAGYTRMYLETVDRMTSANALYQKMGFERLCGQEGNTGHGGCDTFYARAL